MPKQVIVNMDDSYPFGQCEQRTTEKTKIGTEGRDQLLEKVAIVRKLKNDHMIKIQSVLEEQESVHLLFQYVPIKLQTWISNINDQFIQNFRDQLIKFSSFLANNYIKIDFDFKNIGMDQNYNAKYFLDFQFEVDQSINREKLKSLYIREITNMFKPYILNKEPVKLQDKVENKHQHKPSDHHLLENRKSTDYSISPPTNKINRSMNKNKEKALAQYYQEVNMSVDSENQKILQEFMDVLDNEYEQEVKSTKPKIVEQHSENIQIKRQPSIHNVPSNYNQTLNSQVHSSRDNPTYSQQNNINNIGTSNKIAHSIERGINRARELQQGQLFRQSLQLQNRVKNAIEKSLSVIKKFKAIKQN